MQLRPRRSGLDSVRFEALSREDVGFDPRMRFVNVLPMHCTDGRASFAEAGKFLKR